MVTDASSPSDIAPKSGVCDRFAAKYNGLLANFSYGFAPLGEPISQQTLASFHKYLRLCDLCKELAFGSPDALRQNQDFIQLVRAQHVLPPVPGERVSEKG